MHHVEVKELGRTRAVYGFSLKLGLGGKPVIEPFGNVREGVDMREPVVDLLDEEQELHLIAELPGVDGESIRIEAHDRAISITAAGRGCSYVKEVPLPCRVSPSSLQWSYRNGVMEVRVRKDPGKGEGVSDTGR